MLPLNAAALPAPPFPASILFDDIGPEVLAREAEDGTSDAWQTYLRKMLPPVAAEAALRPS